jgi:hypothetical protein
VARVGESRVGALAPTSLSKRERRRNTTGQERSPVHCILLFDRLKAADLSIC